MSEEMPQEEAIAATTPKGNGLLTFLIDFGPLLIFFLVFKFTQSGEGALASTRAAINGTIAFMIAILVAVAVSRLKLGKVSPMLWLSAVLVVGFGGLTIYFHDERFIVMKPTIIYAGFATLLLGGWAMGRPLLKYLLQAAYDSLDETGWLKLSRNWGLFFAAMALANHVMYWLIEAGRMNFETWLTVKVWGVTLLSLIFALSQIPLLMRHGMDFGETEKK
ncbi:MAG: inner membrane-spanning protein YciB [Blastomonas sp.]